jgi:hypothetical protein
VNTEFAGSIGQIAGRQNPLTRAAQLTPSSFGLKTIAEDPELHKMWQNAMSGAMRSPRDNAVKQYMAAVGSGQTPSRKLMKNAFDLVNNNFGESAEAAGYKIAEVHHWNYNRGNFPEQLLDPRNLVPIPEWSLRGPGTALHKLIHRLTRSGASYRSPIAPAHVLPVDTSVMPLAPWD